jgi:hypothetical protein
MLIHPGHLHLHLGPVEDDCLTTLKNRRGWRKIEKNEYQLLHLQDALPKVLEYRLSTAGAPYVVTLSVFPVSAARSF